MGLGNSIISGFRRGVMGPIERPWEVHMENDGERSFKRIVCRPYFV